MQQVPLVLQNSYINSPTTKTLVIAGMARLRRWLKPQAMLAKDFKNDGISSQQDSVLLVKMYDAIFSMFFVGELARHSNKLNKEI